MDDSKENSTFTVSQWEKQIRLSAAKNASQIDEFHLQSTSLTLFILSCTWIIGVLQIFLPWGKSYHNLNLIFQNLSNIEFLFFFLF